jgi:hypothetical protein
MMMGYIMLTPWSSLGIYTSSHVSFDSIARELVSTAMINSDLYGPDSLQNFAVLFSLLGSGLFAP